jgi:nucleoside-diphosphate-sugar epimerase
MTDRIFLAGATGAIGRALVPLLIAAGYAVHGSTRRAERADALKAMGATPVIVDVFNSDALTRALRRIEPSVVIHQLTDLPRSLDPSEMADAVVRNARIRDEGTRNLVRSAIAAGCNRLVAQSIAWAYAPGSKPYDETHPLDLNAQGSRKISVGGVAALERWILTTPELNGTVLRYGQIYGPGTSNAAPTGTSPVHVEAAAWGALLAVQRRVTGVFNLAEDHAEVSSEKAKRELGWNPASRLPDSSVQP